MTRTDDRSSHSGGRYTRLLMWLLFALLAVMILRTAWVCDDAYISFRTVDNFVNGYGLRWNIDERVQGFTNPLWVLLISIPYAITGEMYYTSIFFSFALVLIVVAFLMRRVATTTLGAIFAVVVLLLSKSFMDYTTSGLEQPLLFLLIGVFLWRYTKYDGSVRSLGWLCFIAALSAVARLDTILIYAPALLFGFWQNRWWPAIRAGIVGFLPLIGWEIFAIIYFGFWFPNTYYAKVHSGIPSGAIAKQGLEYFRDSFHTDPLTLVVIAAAIVLMLLRKVRGYTAIALGFLLYFVYIVKVGGDFMGGRFFAVPFLGAAALLGRYAWNRKLLIGAVAVALALGFSIRYPTLLTGGDFGTHGNDNIKKNGIADERGWYYQQTGLLLAKSGLPMPDHEWAECGREYARRGEPVVLETCIGFVGFFSGPTIHFVDAFALTEPLLARLRTPLEEKWRTGHLFRNVPAGYLKTLRSGRNQIADSGLAQYYDKLSMIVRDPIFSTERLSTIWQMNTGKYNHLLAQSWDDSAMTLVFQNELNRPLEQGARWDTAGTIILRKTGADIRFDSLIHAPGVELSLDNNDDYLVYFCRDTVKLGSADIPRRPIEKGGVRIETPAAPEAALEGGYDRIYVLPIDGDGSYSLGHVLPVDSLPPPVSPEN